MKRFLPIRSKCVLLALVCIPLLTTAQSGSGKISGKIIDAISNVPLEGATVTALEDSSGLFIAYAMSNRKGTFVLSGLPLHQKLVILVTYKGYNDSSNTFVLRKVKEVLNSGNWRLHSGVEELDTVTISRLRPPFIIKKDTLEFNAALFKSLPNEVVQDLLRKLPGVRVDHDGTIYVHGKKVDRILVDGRQFFSGDWQMATKNLPGSIIDKVQVTETRDPAREFSSIIKPLTTTVTMNLTLKRENKSGVFGHVAGAVGTADRNQAGVFLNSFNNAKRLSFNGTTGNHAMVMPGSFSIGDGNSGIIKNATTAAINFNNDLFSKGNYSLEYSFNSNNSSAKTKLERLNLLPDQSFIYKSASENKSGNNYHAWRGNWNLDIDSLQKLEGAASVSLMKRTTELMMTAASQTIDGQPINTQQNLNEQTSHPTMAYDNMINYHRFSRDRQTIFSVNWRVSGTTDRGAQVNVARNDFATGEVDSLDQRGDITGRGSGHALSVNLNRSIGQHVVAIFNYHYNNSRQQNERNIYRFSAASGKYDELDSLYSNHIRSLSGSHQATARIGYKAGKFAVEGSAVWLALRQQNRVLWQDSTAHIHQRNISPSAAISYAFSPLMQLVGSYSLMTMRPSADQINPVINVTNPLVIRVGNPLLRSGIFHNYNINFNVYTPDMKWRSSAGLAGSHVKDQVVEDSRFDSSGRQVISFRNVDGNRNVGITWNGGVQFQLSHYRLSLEMNAVANNTIAVGLINGVESMSQTSAFMPSLNVQVSYKTILSLHANMGYEASRTTYSLGGLAPVAYNIKRVQVMVTVSPVKKVQVTTSVFHTYNSQLPADFQRARTYMGAGVTANFLKGERLTAGVVVNDLLNNNVNTSRTVTPTAIETVQVSALKRYGLLTLSYRINEFR